MIHMLGNVLTAVIDRIVTDSKFCVFMREIWYAVTVPAASRCEVQQLSDRGLWALDNQGTRPTVPHFIS